MSLRRGQSTLYLVYYLMLTICYSKEQFFAFTVLSRSLVSLVYTNFEQRPFSFIECLVYAVGLLTFTFLVGFHLASSIRKEAEQGPISLLLSFDWLELCLDIFRPKVSLSLGPALASDGVALLFQATKVTVFTLTFAENKVVLKSPSQPVCFARVCFCFHPG